MVCNFNPVLREGYTLGAPVSGTYKEVLNSDDEAFGGSGTVHNKSVRTHKKPLHGFEQSITITLPPMSTLYFEVPTKRTRKAADKAETAEKTTAKKTAAKAEKPAKAEKAPKKTTRTTKAKAAAAAEEAPGKAEKAEKAAKPKKAPAKAKAEAEAPAEKPKRTRKPKAEAAPAAEAAPELSLIHISEPTRH